MTKQHDVVDNRVEHDRTRHIEIDRHFIKEKLNEGMICIPYIKFSGQLADIFIKGVSSKVFDFVVTKLGINIYTST